jgi:hypothetical protein
LHILGAHASAERVQYCRSNRSSAGTQGVPGSPSGIILDVTVNDYESDIVGGRFYAGIRVGHKVARDMQLLRVSASSRLIAVAFPDYLSRNKAPATPHDLCITTLASAIAAVTG